MLRRSSFFSWERKFDYPEARIEPDIKEKMTIHLVSCKKKNRIATKVFREKKKII